MPRFAAVLTLLVLLLAGCGDDDEPATTSTSGTTGATGTTGASGAEEEPDNATGAGAPADVGAISSCLDDAGLDPSDPQDVKLEGQSAQEIEITAGDLPDNGTVYVFESEEAAAKADDATQLSINVFKETSGPVTAVLITAPSGAEGDEAKEAVSECIAG